MDRWKLAIEDQFNSQIAGGSPHDYMVVAVNEQRYCWPHAMRDIPSELLSKKSAQAQSK